MKTRGLAIALAVVLAGGATFAVFLYVQSIKDDNVPTAQQNMVTVVVPKQDLPAGTKLDGLISSGAFATETVPAEAVVPGAVTDLGQLQGRTTSTFILQGEQITTARLQGSRQPTGGLLGIPAGYRAASVQLDGERLVNGVVQPGDHVAVYLTTKIKDSEETVVLVPDALVLDTTSPAPSTAFGTGTPASGGAVVTLALTPRDAAEVILGQEQRGIWLSLLPPNAHGRTQPPVRLSEVG
jgi:pilus assembly protein CpaB